MMKRGRVAPVFQVFVVACMVSLILPAVAAWLPDSASIARAEPVADKPGPDGGADRGGGKPAEPKPAPPGQARKADAKQATPMPTAMPTASAAAALTTNASPGGASVAAVSLSVNLDQCANLTKPCVWQNGSLNGTNSAFPEGGVVPFRLAVEGLTAQPKHVIHINYDFTASGHKSYDFLATYNASENARLCDPPGAVSSLCPSILNGTLAPATAVFPSDPYVADGLPVSGAEQRYASTGKTRNLTIYGGTITSISTPAHTGDPAGNSSVDLVVEFTAAGQAVLLLWGGHLADSGYWDVAKAGGTADGAAMVSGAPWHMRTQGLDGSGNRNQDRSIQSSAIIKTAPTPTATATPTTPPAPPAPPPPPSTPPTATPGPGAPGSALPPSGSAPGSPPPGGSNTGSPTGGSTSPDTPIGGSAPPTTATGRAAASTSNNAARPGSAGFSQSQLPNTGGIPDGLLLAAFSSGLAMIGAGVAIRRR